MDTQRAGLLFFAIAMRSRPDRREGDPALAPSWQLRARAGAERIESCEAQRPRPRERLALLGTRGSPQNTSLKYENMGQKTILISP